MVSRNTSKRVGIWIRVSTEDQVRGESPETHERRARAYAESRDWEVVEVYRLDAVSGKTVIEHPDAKRMLSDIRSKHVTGLIFSKLARLARNTRELLDFADHFRNAGADLVSLGEAIDTSTPAGRLFYTMLAAMATWEREEIAARVAASVPIRAQLGKPLGGAATFGYRWEDQKLVPDEKEAPVRKLVYELYKEHRRRKTVARVLNERGYRTRNGGLFSDTTVERLIRDTTAKGIRRANHTKSTGINGGWEEKPKEDWVLIPVEPIVSEELWNETNALLDANRGTPKRQTKQVVHLFAGLTQCSCGNKMYVPSNSPKYTCSKCRNKIPIKDLEAIFHEELRGFVFSPDEISGHVKAGLEQMAEFEELADNLSNERKSLTEKADGLIELFQAKALDKVGFAPRYEPIRARVEQIDLELPTLLGKRDTLRVALDSKEEVLVESKDLVSRWTDMPQHDRRQIVESIMERVVIGDGEVEFNFLYNPGVIASSSQPH